MIRALIFDFDGLILDTETPVFQSWQEIYDSYGCQLDFEKWVVNIGKGEDDFNPILDLEQLLGRRLNSELLTSLHQERERALVEVQPVLPGVEDYLQAARRLGLTVGLASCSSREWVTGHLERLSLMKYFDCILTGEDARSLKPEPELYRKTLDCLEVLPKETVAFEDSTHGILAARRAGIFCVFVPNPLSRWLPTNHANLHLDSLGDIPLEELLRKIEAQMS
jgi:HAD superfamily hydrolase (TIGR01509 family)